MTKMEESKMIDSVMIDIDIIESKMTKIQIIETEEIDEEEIDTEEIDEEIIDEEDIIESEIVILDEENIEEVNGILKIPLRNKKKEIIYHFSISNRDYEIVSKSTWSVSLRKQVNSIYKNIHGKVNGIDTQLSHFIYGKPKPGYVIDHIDNDSLNNTRENLHEITDKQNSQNRKKIIKENTTSKYLGVSLIKKATIKKWRAQGSKKDLGCFEEEIDAAIVYDKYTFIIYGEKASTNNLVKYEDTLNLTVEDLLSNKEQKLPNNILPGRNKKNKFFAKITYNKKAYTSKDYDTIEEAIKQLEIFKKNIEQIKKKEELEHFTKEITRNTDGLAIINIYDKKKNLKGSTIVDDDKWHKLLNRGIHYKGKYISIILAKTDKNYTKHKMGLHRYLMNDPEGMKVDHINNNPEDNRISNLRVSTDKQNSYNTVKRDNCSSIYKGVFYDSKKIKKNYYTVSIAKDHKTYNLGCYEIEIQAALAYNLKATELFKEFANINVLDIDEELYNKYKNEILLKWENKQKS